MPNNFRKSGSYYISKDGNDANAGTGPNIPKASFDDYSTGTNIAGAGEYKGAFIFGIATFIADGLAKLNLTADCVFTLGINITDVLNFYGTSGGPGRFIVSGNGFGWGAGGLGYQNYESTVFENTVFKNGGFDIASVFSKCVIRDSPTQASSKMRWDIQKSLIFNSVFDTANASVPPVTVRLVNSYCDAATVFGLTGLYTPANFTNNNFRGQIVVGGTPYELKKQKDGTAINPNPGVADLAVIDATVYDRGNFSEDPLFLNLSKGDYWAVSPASPNLFADSSGIGNIGGVFAAVNTQATDPAFASPAANNGLSDVAGGIVWASLPGTRLSQPIQVATTEGKPLKKGIIAALMNFNSSETIGGAENKNVIATENYVSGTAGANPRRVNVIKMRVKSTLPAPTADASFDNNGYITPGDFFEFEVLGNDTDFMVDTNFKGTGDPAFIPAGAAPISPVWVQILLTEQEGLG